MNELLKILLSLSLSGSLLLLFLFLCKPLFKEKISKQWQYYIWLVVIARLLLPLAPETNLMGSVFRQIDTSLSQAKITIQAEQDNPSTDFTSHGTLLDFQDVTAGVRQAKDNTPMAKNILNMAIQNIGVIWLIVAVALFIRKMTTYQSFVKYIQAGRVEISDIELWERVGKLLEQTNVEKAVSLYTNNLISSPLLVGFFRPCIMLPTTALSDTDFEYTILHELTHYKRRDIFYKWLVRIALCVHWFNPLVYLMGREINRSCELSCDEAIIRKLDRHEQRAYGDTLLNAVGVGGKYKDAVASVTLYESRELLKERLDAIMKFQTTKRWMIPIVVIFSLCLLGGGFALGAYTAQPVTEKTQDKQPILSMENYPDAALQEEHGQYLFGARQLMEQGHVVFSWYFNDTPYDDLWINIDGPDLELNGSNYKKVVRFQNIEQLKAATEAVFTKEFCEANFYSLFEIGKFIEIDGALYVGDQGGISEGCTYPPKEYIVRSATEDSVVLTAICEGYDPISENPDAPLIDYSFELVLHSYDENNLNGMEWRADSYYSYNADGFQGDLVPYKG